MEFYRWLFLRPSITNKASIITIATKVAYSTQCLSSNAEEHRYQQDGAPAYRTRVQQLHSETATDTAVVNDGHETAHFMPGHPPESRRLLYR